LDLFSRKGKAPGGYQSTLCERRKPFIFMNSVGTHSDLMVLLHESGHAMHSCECNDEPLLAYRHAPSEFCEVGSMGLELLAEPYLDVFYANEDDRRRAVRENLEGIVYTIAWVAVIDSFQHWLYENSDHSREERCNQWVTLYDRYSACAYDWTGEEDSRNYRWHRQLHIFQWPFYYIEYGMSQLGALGLWRKSRQDLPGTVKQYRAALSLGGSKPLPQLYNAAGLPFDFSAKTMKPLMETLMAEWEKTLD
ncbi:MAG: hypothetical protein JW709_12750, partial [Sedimentisphaerales bacterium]|nr:hypothetical protein [Sedimentisphaerales bacterium]